MFTNNSKKKLKNIAVFLKEEGGEDDEDEQEELSQEASDLTGRGRRNAILDSKLRVTVIVGY